MPTIREEWRACYCMPTRQMVVHYTPRERARMVMEAFGEVVEDMTATLTYPVRAFAKWLTTPGDTIQMKEIAPVCFHEWQLDNLTATRQERLMSPEAVREHHRRLANDAYESEAGRRAFEAHKRLHHEAARAIRAERDK